MAKHHALLARFLRALRGRFFPAAALLLPFAAAMLFEAGAAYADVILLPQPEAPTTIFSTTLGSADVSLSLLGSWKGSLTLGAVLLLAPGLAPQWSGSFPGMDTGIVPNQIPDVTVSLMLLNSFFLDVSILGSLQDRYLQMGYRSAEGVLRSVVLGTQEVTIEPSTLMQVPSQAPGSLGAMARLVSGSSTNDLLLRWDAASRKRKTFVGKNELAEQEIGIDAYVRGMYFFLPDTGPFDAGSLQVFLEDPAGTYVSGVSDGNRKYRLATYDDVVLDATLGLVTLNAPAKGRVLVHYAKGGAEVGAAAGTPGLPDDASGTRNPAIAKTFSWAITYFGLPMSGRKVDLTAAGVGTCLLLWEPGDNSPFEIDNSYAYSSSPPTDVSRISYRLNPKDASASLPVGLLYQSIPAENRFMVLQSQDLRATFANFLPFSDPSGLLYGPRRDSISGLLDFDIIVQFLTPVSDLILETNVIVGSVQVTVNGVPESRFEVDPASGRLTMLTEVLPTDRIDVTYSRIEPGTSGGDILFAWRDRIPISEAVNLSVSAGLRWNANPWTFSQQAFSKSGTVIAAAGIDGKLPNLSYAMQAGVAYTNPDTTGILRLFGMEGDSLAIDMSEEGAYPASAPDPSEPGMAGISQMNRGLLFYRDYRLYGAVGSVTLQPIEAPAPDQMPYANGNRMGPYNVSGSSGNLNSLNLVLEYSLQAGQWVGTQLPVAAGMDVDLSRSRAVTVRLRGLNMTGSVSVYLQLGSISEDLDGTGFLTGTIQAESSATEAGFPFVEQAHGVTLRVGAGPRLQGNGLLDSEDRNANGILDLEDPNRIVTLSVPSPGTTFASTTIALSDSDRQKLVQARGVRIIVTSAGGSDGQLIVDSISIEGSQFSPIPGGTDSKSSIQVQEVSESLAQVPPPSGGDLSTKYQSTYKLFHPNGEPNEALQIAWTGTNYPFSVQGFVPQGTGGIQYDTIVSYLRSPTPGVTFTFSLWDASTPPRGIVWSVSVSDNNWHEVKVSRKDNVVSVDGTSAGNPITFDASYANLARLQVQVSGAVSAGGVLYIDEVYCTDPAGALGAAFVGSLSAQFPGILLKAGNVALLSNVAIRQDVSLLSAGFTALYGIPSAAEDLSSRMRLDADLLFLRTSLDLTLRESAGSLYAFGGHRITIPAAGAPVTVVDAFALTPAGGFSREDALAVTAAPLLSFALDASANSDPVESIVTGRLFQAWRANLELNPLPSVAVSTVVSLAQAVDDYQLLPGWYGEQWLGEAALLLPWDGPNAVQRNERMVFKAGLAPAPVGFSLEADAGADGSDYTTAGFSQENDLAYSLSLLLNLGQGSVSNTTLSVAYERALSVTTSPAAGPGFSTETSEFGRVLSQQGYMLTLAPFAEVFSDNTGVVLPAWQSASSGTYSPTVTVSLQRSYGSRLIDLFIPSSIELSVGQVLAWTPGLPKTTVYLRPKTVTRAINLFGQLGAFPILPLVRTDEYSLSLGASVDGSPGSLPVLSTLSVDAYVTLTGLGENDVTLMETLRRDQATSVVVTNVSQVLLDWKSRPPGGIPVPLLPEEVAKTGHFENRESAQVTIGYQDVGSFHAFNLVLGHSTTLVFEGHGSAKAGLNVGTDAENLGASGIAWRFAVNAVLEATLTF